MASKLPFACVSDIPRLSFKDPKCLKYISEQKPVVIYDSDIITSGKHWDLQYLAARLADVEAETFISDNCNFKYYESKKALSSFIPPYKKEKIAFKELVKLFQAPGNKKYYVQEPLTDKFNDQNVISDFRAFNWEWIMARKSENNWGELTSNLLLLGMEGNLTPAHYDEQENFLCQLRGSKRVTMLSPDQSASLYPHPVHHPHDRQSQVDLTRSPPDDRRFPMLRKAVAQQATLKPGELIYIPNYWWHHIESLGNRVGLGTEVVSVTFWFKAAPVTDVVWPLSAGQKISLQRNIEKMIIEGLRRPDEVPTFMQQMVYGRYGAALPINPTFGEPKPEKKAVVDNS